MPTLEAFLQILGGATGTGAVLGFWLFRSLKRIDTLEAANAALHDARLAEQKSCEGRIQESIGARVSDEKNRGQQLIGMLDAQREILESVTASNHEQAEATTGLGRSVEELRKDVGRGTEATAGLGRSVEALRAHVTAPKGGR